MPRCLTVTPHLPADELERRYRQSRDAVERGHWQMLWLVAQGHHCPAVAAMTGYSDQWVRTIVHRYNAAGSDGIVDQRHANPGATRLLSSALREELRHALADPPPDGGLWTSRKVAAWMGRRLGRPVGEPRGWETLRELGFTPQRPRPTAVRADSATQAGFKKGGSSARSTE